MRFNTFCSFMKKISVVSAAVLLLVLTSCGNVNVDTTDNIKGGKTATVHISIDEEIRTARPMVIPSDFTKFTLTCDGTEIGSWETSNGVSAYENMNRSRLSVTTGTHSFELTGKLPPPDTASTEANTAIYKKELPDVYVEGDTLLNFSLEIASIPTEGTGSVKIIADCSAISDKVNFAYVNFWNSSDETSYLSTETLFYGSNLNISSDGKFTYNLDSYAPAGQYIVEFQFYESGSSAVVGRWPELVTILPGRESTTEIEVTSVCKKYDIKLNYYDSYTYTWSYTVLDTIDLSSEYRTGYDFDGWFESEDFSGEPVTGWQPNTHTGNIELYAKWTPKTYSITYYNTDGTPFSGTIESGYPTTHTYGTDTVLKNAADLDDEHSFVGWYTGNVADDGTVTLNSYRYTKLDASWYPDISLYAKYAKAKFHVSADGSDAAYVDDETAFGDGTEAHPYKTVIAAVNAAAAQNITADYRIIVHGEILENIILYNSTITAENASSLTIEGATGNSVDKLNGKASGTVISVQIKVPLILKNITVTNGKAGSSAQGGGITLTQGTRLTLAEGSLITGNTATFSYVASYSSEWNSKGDQSPGGGIKVTTATLIMEEGSEVSGNTAAGTGAGIMIAGGSFTMNGGVIRNNTVITDNTSSYHYYGGAGVYVFGTYNSTFTMNGGEIKDNTVSATGYYMGGGGVYLYKNTAFTMNGGSISGNSAYYGGGLYSLASSNTLKMTGGTINNNTATHSASSGGAVYSSSGLQLSGSAYVPFGDDSNNDVRCIVKVTGELTAQSPVATINSSSYEEGASIVVAADGITLTDEMLEKFAVAKYGWETYLEDNAVKIRRPVYTITYKDKNGADLSGTLPEDAPFTHKYGTETILPVPEREGYTFQGWYKTAGCTDTAVLSIGETAISSDITLYTFWTKETLVFTIDITGITLTADDTAEDGTVTVTAADGFTGYAWKIDGKTPSSAITGAEVSEDGKSLTFNKANLTKGLSYVISVTVDSNGLKQKSSVTVKKQEAE